MNFQNFMLLLMTNLKDEFDKKVNKSDQLQTKGIEVGHIFYFGDKYSKPMNCSVDSKEGKEKHLLKWGLTVLAFQDLWLQL